MSINNRLYYLDIKINDLSKYNINITESVKQNLIGKGQYINIENIYSDKDKVKDKLEPPIPQLIIGYNDYPLYNIKEGRNLVDNYLKQNSEFNNKNVIQEIFTYDNSNNFNTFYNTITDQYKKYEDPIANNYLSNLKNETIQNIKKICIK